MGQTRKKMKYGNVTYPIVECGYFFRGEEYYLPQCCFHDLFESDLNEIAGMGLAIIGNVVKMVQAKLIPMGARLWLRAKFSEYDKPTNLPWPGMPNDDPNLPASGFYLDPTNLPFDFAMFIDENGNGGKRIDRLELMRRIHDVWVPHIFDLLLKKV